MSSGGMRERVAFKRVTRTKRSDGGYDTSTSTISTVWASVQPVAAREGEQAGRLFGSTSYIITVYSSSKPSDLTTDDMITWTTGGSVNFNIRGIRQAGPRASYTEIIAEKGAIQ
jgi:head-tail adaptor